MEDLAILEWSGGLFSLIIIIKKKKTGWRKNSVDLVKRLN